MLICREKAQKAQKATVGGHLIKAFARRWTQINADTENGIEQEQTERTENPNTESELRELL
jgi:hypothetical protein